MRRLAAFSLVEVTLAIGIIGFALIAIFALIPVGLNSSREAVDATHQSLIGKDVQARVKSSVIANTFTTATDVTLGPWFYNRDGVFVDVSTSGYNSVLYRADAIIHSIWNSVPSNVDATVLRPVTVILGSPVNAATHASMGTSTASFTFYVRKP
jgi:uncharacterized protein (TIGR02598 family)